MRVRIGAPVGVLAVAILAGVAPLALAAHHVVLDEDEVALLEALAVGELAAGLGDKADVLVAHDGGLVVRRMRVELDVGAADAGDLHLQQRAVRRNVRHRVFADFGLARCDADRRQHFFSHWCPLVTDDALLIRLAPEVRITSPQRSRLLADEFGELRRRAAGRHHGHVDELRCHVGLLQRLGRPRPKACWRSPAACRAAPPCAHHDVTTKPGSTSATVGTSGSIARRACRCSPPAPCSCAGADVRNATVPVRRT